MFFEYDENDFGKEFNEWWKNLSEEEKAEIDRKGKEEENRMLNHPLYKKSNEILEIVEAIIESLPEEERDYHSPMIESAMMLGPKFAGAYNCDMWLLVMQNAALMRYHAQYVATGTYGFDMFGEGAVDKRYVELLRTEMKTYKKLFNEWMEEVHAMPKDFEGDQDEWGVFVRPKS
jgi:hypothetical protein